MVTADAMEQERMYRFFRDNGIRRGLQEGINTSSSMQGSAMEEKYRDFLRAFWRLSEQDGYPVVLREFEQVISLIQGNARMTQNELNRPFSILSVDWEAISPPSTLSCFRWPATATSFNLATSDLSLVESTHTEQFRRLMARAAAWRPATRAANTSASAAGQRQQQVLGTRHPRLQRNQRLPLRHPDPHASAVGAL